ncbi:MAG: WD40 repeat domain-containing protein [Rhodomicrobium sp.]
MRLRVMLALTLALLSCFFAAEGTSTNRENERQGQAAGAGPADINIQPNIGTPEKPEYALLSPDKRVLATSDRKRIKIWDISTGRLLRTLEHFAYNTGIAFAPDGHSIFAAYKDGAVRIWNVETGLLTDTIEVQPQQDWGGDGVWTLSIDEERQLLLAGTEEGKIFGWNLSRGLKLFSFDSGGLGRISSLGLSADGSQLVATGHDSVKWFDVRTRKPVRTYKLPNEDTRKDFVEYLGDELFLVRNEEYGCKAEAWIADLSSGAAEYMRILPPVTFPSGVSE